MDGLGAGNNPTRDDDFLPFGLGLPKDFERCGAELHRAAPVGSEDSPQRTPIRHEIHIRIRMTEGRWHHRHAVLHGASHEPIDARTVIVAAREDSAIRSYVISLAQH